MCVLYVEYLTNEQMRVLYKSFYYGALIRKFRTCLLTPIVFYYLTVSHYTQCSIFISIIVFKLTAVFL